MKQLLGCRFSIVIPCYNEAKYLPATLSSLQAQKTAAPFEIIVVDNNSTDETAAIAKRFGVRLVSEKRAGVCYARQAGSLAAKGEIIISTDADTVFAADWLHTIDATFQRHSSCVAVAGPCNYYDGPWWGQIYPRLLFGSVSMSARLFKRPFYITATNTAFKRSAWQGYDVSATQGGDELLLLRSLQKNGEVIFNNSNPVFTSGRRLKRGLAYNIFVTCLFYYVGAYYANQLFGRRVLGSAPACRENEWLASPAPRYSYALVAVIVVLVLALGSAPTRHDIGHVAHYGVSALAHEVSELI